MPADLAYPDHVAAETARLCTVLRDADPAAAVPTCPGWTVGDLVWHLAEVQYFWATVVHQRRTVLEEIEAEDLVRPVGYPELVALLKRWNADLVAVLRSTPPTTPVWTWADEQTAGFVRRRQAHEALVHRVDAEHAVGQRSALDPALAADGVDEALRVMFGDAPPGAELVVDEAATVRVRSTDTGHTWLVTLGRYSGPDPGANGGPDSELPQGPTLLVAASDHGLPTAATLSASAADLDCWFWSRPGLGPVDLAGEVAVLEGLREVVAAGIQ